MQKLLCKKLVASFLGLTLIVVLLLFAIPVQTASADTLIWEKVDYENEFATTSTVFGDAYGGAIKEIAAIQKYKYLYIFLQGSGGIGGASANGEIGYGGGSGGFAIVKLDLSEAENLIIILGNGGGKVELEEDEYWKEGDGAHSAILALRSQTESSPFTIEGVVCFGGKGGTTTDPGEGGAVDDGTKNNLLQILYSQNGVIGGQASHSFSVDLGFRTEHFIYHPTGANPSGKGGGASVYHRGGDGGILFKNGSNGLMGAGGGGAGKGATAGGYGGDAYMEIYGSNI